MEIPQGNTMENSGKHNPKKGFKSPSEQRRKWPRQPAVVPFGKAPFQLFDEAPGLEALRTPDGSDRHQRIDQDPSAKGLQPAPQ